MYFFFDSFVKQKTHCFKALIYSHHLAAKSGNYILAQLGVKGTFINPGSFPVDLKITFRENQALVNDGEHERAGFLYFFLSINYGKQKQFTYFECPSFKQRNEPQLPQGYQASGDMATPHQTDGNMISSHYQSLKSKLFTMSSKFLQDLATSPLLPVLLFSTLILDHYNVAMVASLLLPEPKFISCLRAFAFTVSALPPILSTTFFSSKVSV